MITYNKILITGISGLVGNILYEGLNEKYSVTGLDANPFLETPTLVADSTNMDMIEQAYDDVDLVIDLASVPSQFSPWDVIYDNNILCTYNSLELARLKGVKRYIFASSNHVTGMYELDKPYLDIISGDYSTIKTYPRITIDMPIRPDGYYGIGKAFGESLGRYYSEKYNMSIMCLRIGTVNPENKPKDIRHFATLLTHSDLIHLVESCIKASDDIKFGIYYGVSNNKWRIWDIGNSQTEISYSPKDNAEFYRGKTF
jgi:nucleoside-diphosphate-sugar epimerase